MNQSQKDRLIAATKGKVTSMLAFIEGDKQCAIGALLLGSPWEETVRKTQHIPAEGFQWIKRQYGMDGDHCQRLIQAVGIGGHPGADRRAQQVIARFKVDTIKKPRARKRGTKLGQTIGFVPPPTSARARALHA